MSFLHPEFLYYMLPLIIILFGLLLTQKESHATFFSSEVMQRLRVSSNTLTLKARNALFFLIAVLMTIALAGPVIKDGKIEVTAKSADIMIALDISDSMLAEDVYPNRLKLAKQKALELLHLAPNERIGVIAFAKNSYLVSPLSFDHEAVAFLLKKLNTNSITEQGTDFMSMLQVVDKSIKQDAKKYLLILSDGGDKKDFSQEIAFAKKHDIAVFVLGVGTPQGAPIKLKNGEFIKQNGKIIVSKLNDKIADLATKTGGVYIESVNSDADVKAMLQEIERHSKKKELKSEKIEKYIPLFYYPLGLALLLLLIATSSMSKRVKVEVPGLFILGLLLFNSSASHAGLLDFIQLDKAKKAYEQKNYAKSAKIYDEYAKNTNHNESFYNVGNALYKEGKYKEAIKNYEKATFNDKVSRARNFANMGNAYAKIGDEASLKKAIEAYKTSLKLHEDKDTRENLEAVKKALKKKQQQKKQQQKNKNQKNKNQKKQQQKNQKNQQNQKSQDNKKNEKKQDNKEQKNKQHQDNKKDQKSEQRKSQKPSEDEKKQQKKNAEKQKNAKQTEKKEKERKQKSQQKSAEKKQKKDKKKPASVSAAQAEKMKNRMSDAEEAKWLKSLNNEQSTYLYRLNQSNKKKENSNEKPW
ncbi:VWA domain-containing protein [Sulfurimonas sp. SWIR-19]|uniref:VWA domain-containing protein n=1 Tax=Sulfurimonas sp. SWIR-19 TaxID=2878390 RepID=UPI001CF37E29|nr:VWA domain-containing protein [Sulfurimonas sp. SWIR-19]UCN01012.1 VWA domain-containing protein [Sulfurimonas sp. SWIR-19]